MAVRTVLRILIARQMHGIMRIFLAIVRRRLFDALKGVAGETLLIRIAVLRHGVLIVPRHEEPALIHLLEQCRLVTVVAGHARIRMLLREQIPLRIAVVLGLHIMTAHAERRVRTDLRENGESAEAARREHDHKHEQGARLFAFLEYLHCSPLHQSCAVTLPTSRP